ncbi:MAG: DUF3276 family protein [Bacteroidales bacterium]|nr:DUF3276 family protein [Bacteroidales bacterium]
MDFNAERPGDKKEIIYTHAVKAGKRIYYFDVKRSRNGEMFLAMTESKRVTGEGADSRDISFEKHKIFLYQEDFAHFTAALQDVMGYIAACQEKDAENSADVLTD